MDWGGAGAGGPPQPPPKVQKLADKAVEKKEKKALTKQPKITSFIKKPPDNNIEVVEKQKKRSKKKKTIENTEKDRKEKMRGYWVSLAAKNRKRKDDTLSCRRTVDAPVVQSPSETPNGSDHDAPSTVAAEPHNLGSIKISINESEDDSMLYSERGLENEV